MDKRLFYWIARLRKECISGERIVLACPYIGKECEIDVGCYLRETSRHLADANGKGEREFTSRDERNIPAKVSRSFPLIPWLRRLFLPSKTPRLRGGIKRIAWTMVLRDTLLAEDPRNVRIGSASDQINLIETATSISHDTWWAVILAICQFRTLSSAWKDETFHAIAVDARIPWPRGMRYNVDIEPPTRDAVGLGACDA